MYHMSNPGIMTLRKDLVSDMETIKMFKNNLSLGYRKDERYPVVRAEGKLLICLGKGKDLVIDKVGNPYGLITGSPTYAGRR